MKYFFVPLLSICVVVSISSFATGGSAQTAYAPGTPDAAAADEETTSGSPAMAEDWPLTFNSGGISWSIFSPLCDSWNGHDFIGRSAVAAQVPGEPQPIYGTVELNAITLVDKNARTVQLANIRVTSANFPTARALTQTYLAALRGLPQRAPSLSLDKVQESLSLTPPTQTQRLVNTPPRIITSTRPAVLVSIDGPPVWKPVKGTSLDRSINTSVLLLRDASGIYYLHLFDGYLRANSLDGGHWTVAPKIPDGAALAQQQALTAGNVDLMSGNPDANTGREPSLTTSAVPDVFVARTPAELVTFSGPPAYAAIPGTDLLYAYNTSGNVFKLLSDQQSYILLSGRWFRAPSLNGPWQFVPGNELSHDFANIPDNSPRANVKASVPGTAQAQQALIANSIPQSAAVPLKQAMEDPQIDGTPQLAPIEGTPLQYVVNSGTPIIKVDSQSWYAVQNGVWYFSTSVDGPWSVATSVPPVIYTIPPSSPLHYLTYVQVYGSTPDTAYDGYTPGYMGTEVGDDGTVVYGTGFNYQPWVGSVWFSPPVTWGSGFAPCWTPWWGWGFNCGFGWGCRFPAFGRFGRFACSPPFPCFAGFRSFHSFGHHGFIHVNHFGFAHTSVNIFHKNNSALISFHRSGVPGTPAGFGQRSFNSFNSRTGKFAGANVANMQTFRGSRNTFNRSGGFIGGPAGMNRPFIGGPASMGRSFMGGPAGMGRPMTPVVRPMTPAPNVVWRQGGWNVASRSQGIWTRNGFRTFPPGTSFGGMTRSGGSFQGGGGWNRGGGGWNRGGGPPMMGGGFRGGGGFNGGGGGGHMGR